MLQIIVNPKGNFPTYSETITIVEEYEFDSYIYSIEFVRAERWRNIKNYGDVPSICTQCILRLNGFVIGVGYCFKDSREKEDNKIYSYKISLSKAIANSERNISKETKKLFWDKIFETF